MSKKCLQAILPRVKDMWEQSQGTIPLDDLAHHFGCGKTTIRRALVELGFKPPCTFHKTEAEVADLQVLQHFELTGEDLHQAALMYRYLASKGHKTLQAIEGRINVF